MTDLVAIAAEAGRYAAVLQRAAAAVVKGDVENARAVLAPIAGERWTTAVVQDPGQQGDGLAKRVPIRERDRAQTLIRDGFRCQVCGGHAAPRGVLVAFSDLFPAELPYHPHYKGGEIHPVYWLLAAEADHVNPSSHGGSSELANLRTIHALCNTKRGNAALVEAEFGLSADPGWDGLVSAWPALVAVAAAERPRYSGASYHPVRMRAFGIR